MSAPHDPPRAGGATGEDEAGRAYDAVVALLHRGRGDEALDAARRCPDAGRGRYLVAWTLTRLERWPEARAAWDDMVAQGGAVDAIGELFRALSWVASAGVRADVAAPGYGAGDRGLYAPARMKLRVLLEVGSADDAARGVLEFHSPIERAAALDVLDAEADAGRVEKAIWVARALVAMDPEDPEAWAAVARLARALGRDDESLRAARVALASPPLAKTTSARLRTTKLDPVGHAAIHMGRALCEDGERARALPYLQLAIDLFEPRGAPLAEVLGTTWMSFGESLLALGRFPEAAFALGRAAERLESAARWAEAATARERRSVALAELHRA